MKRGKISWALLAVMVVIAAAGTQPARALPGFYDYGFAIDNTVSSMTITATVDPALGLDPQTDDDSSSLSGTIRANLNPLEGAFSQIQIHEINMIADDDMSMSMNWDIFVAKADADVDTSDVGLLLGGTEGYGTVGPVTTVGSGGSFTQTDNEVQAIGTMNYSIYAWAILLGTVVDMEDTLELIDDSQPQSADLTGTVTSSGDTVTLELDVDMVFDLKAYLLATEGEDPDYSEYADYLDSGTVTIEGTIVAYADIPLLGDVNDDGIVDLADLTALGGGWGVGDEWSEGDLNLDTNVDLADLTILGGAWGNTASGDPVNPGAAPEPATMSLLGIGALALIRRKK